MRKVEVINDTIKQALVKKDDYVEEMLSSTNRLEEIEKEAKKLSGLGDELITKLAREEEKIRPEIEREIENVELGEWEELSRIYLEKDDPENKGKLFFDIADRLEEEIAKLEQFKIDFKNKKDEPKQSKQSEQLEENISSDTEQDDRSIKDGGNIVLPKAW